MQPCDKNSEKNGTAAGGTRVDAESPGPRARWQRLGELIFTSDPRQRVRIMRSLLSALVFVICVGLIVYCSKVGLMRPQDGIVLASCIFVSSTGFYLVLRSGYNLRFKDPALTLPQILAALTWICGAYGIMNEAHGGALMLFALVQVFGVFNMSVRSARISSAYAVASMGATILYKSLTRPDVYPARVEWVNFLFVAIIMPAISVLASQLTRIRERTKAQKRELEAALARIQELATRDELTGLTNRRHMTQVLHEHAARQKRNATGFGVAVVDLDHFKRINDTYGHGVGDEVLRGFAREACHRLRETDIVARWGGEEFLVILIETSGGCPGAGLERLRKALTSLPICPSVPSLRVTFSAGLTLYRLGEPIDVAIDRADKALYRAKAAGRDRTLLLE